MIWRGRRQWWLVADTLELMALVAADRNGLTSKLEDRVSDCMMNMHSEIALQYN